MSLQELNYYGQVQYNAYAPNCRYDMICLPICSSRLLHRKTVLGSLMNRDLSPFTVIASTTGILICIRTPSDCSYTNRTSILNIFIYYIL